MRGKREQLVDDRSASRIIPAHAGQTRRGASPRPASPDHPRACGANDLPVLQFTERSGSSPRMRGKHGVERQNRLPDRIIPAHAGQTGCRCWVDGTGSDHPRACGANLQPGREGEADAGSSPRMRGKHRRNHGRNRLGRIIPAHAGQTDTGQPRSPSIADHPRACGANTWRKSFMSAPAGSSPRMRGKQSDFMRKLLSAGPSIIGFAQWLQSSYYCSCLQSSAKTPISRGTTPTSLFLGFQNSITLLLLT